ncbi:hypothetical protein I7I51_01919 [Histoplasma capsulatum]|uniref:Uncharacterized protein n=1 Tax=Ajellomyces capsulatus TaxID=5037 RepID=A0A8A1MG23_AJECA|nr:hypothetical protein I7I51_01919 [Histoplasma capsulatum]
MPTIDHFRATAPLFELNVSFRSLDLTWDSYGKCSFVIIPEQIGVSGGTLEKPTPIVPVGRGVNYAVVTARPGWLAHIIEWGGAAALPDERTADSVCTAHGQGLSFAWGPACQLTCSSRFKRTIAHRITAHGEPGCETIILECVQSGETSASRRLKTVSSCLLKIHNRVNNPRRPRGQSRQ